jgi:hypothetical protein
MDRQGMIAQINSNLFAPLIGQTAHGCWLGYGSVLFLEFGQPQPLRDGRAHPSGEWGLRSDQIEWRIEQRDQIIAGSEDDRATMENGIEQIDGKTFVSGEILQPSGDSVLKFSDDLVLRTFVVSSEEDSRWIFRDREGRYFHLGPDRAYPEEQPLLQAGQESR